LEFISEDQLTHDDTRNLTDTIYSITATNALRWRNRFRCPRACISSRL